MVEEGVTTGKAWLRCEDERHMSEADAKKARAIAAKALEQAYYDFRQAMRAGREPASGNRQEDQMVMYRLERIAKEFAG